MLKVKDVRYLFEGFVGVTVALDEEYNHLDVELENLPSEYDNYLVKSMLSDYDDLGIIITKGN